MKTHFKKRKKGRTNRMEEENKRECGGGATKEKKYVNIGKHILTFKRPQI